MFTFRAPDGKEDGPHPPEQIKIWIREGLLSPHTLAVKSGETVWKKLYSYPEFFAVGPTQPPFMVPTVVVAATQAGMPYLKRPPMPPQSPGAGFGTVFGAASTSMAGRATVASRSSQAPMPSFSQMPLYDSSQTAAPGDRVVASIIDGLVWMLCLMPLWLRLLPHLDGAADGAVSLESSIIFASITAGTACLVVQGWMLATRGQSIGKSLMRLRVVLNSDSDEPPGFVAGVIVRWWLTRLLHLIPVVFLVDFLFLFREDRRCLHDYVAGTRVIAIDD
jgi:uncharacterized RDD family membrane protein YckC